MRVTAIAGVSPPAIPPDGDVSKGPLVTAITWVEFGIALILLLARTWTRIRIIRFWGWDDAIMYLALMCACINSALLQVSIDYGTGRHTYYLTDNEVLMANKFNWISQGFHVMSATWGKVSFAAFLLRILDKAKSQRYYFYTGISLLIIVNATSIGVIYGQCKNTADLWATERKGSCWIPIIHRSVSFAQGSFSALSDLVLALYPLIAVWNWRMAQRLKLVISFVTTLGVVAMTAAIIKTIQVDRPERVTRRDYTFETAHVCIWIATEQYFIIIAACMPALAPLLKMLRVQSPKAPSDPSRLGYDRSTRGILQATAPIHPHARKCSGKSGSTRSGIHGFSIYPRGDYTVKTWTDRPEIEAERNSIGTDEETVPTMGYGIAEAWHGGIMKTLEVQVMSDRGSTIPNDSETELPKTGSKP